MTILICRWMDGKTICHYNEYIMKVVLAGKPAPDTPNFVKVFRTAGINIVHLAEFHYTAHPKGPDEQRLNELKALFTMCNRFSTGNFLLLPGEEPTTLWWSLVGSFSSRVY